MRFLAKVFNRSFLKLVILTVWIILFQIVINKYAIETGRFKSEIDVDKIDLKHFENRLRLSGLISHNYNSNSSSIDHRMNLIVMRKAHEFFEEMKSEGLENELKKFYFKGERKHSILLSNFRSGSSFIGDFIQSVPGTFYNFEPLINVHLKYNLARYSNRIRRIKKFLRCNFSDVPDYFEHEVKQKYLFKQTRVLENVREKDIALDHNFISRVCQIYPYQSMKVIRIELEGFKRTFDDNELNMKVVLLIRDPRAVMNSMNGVNWCQPDLIGCTGYSPELYCDSLVREHYTAKRFIKFYPEYLRIIRYEDFLEDPMKIGKKILDFYELPFTNRTWKFLLKHTTVDGEY